MATFSRLSFSLIQKEDNRSRPFRGPRDKYFRVYGGGNQRHEPQDTAIMITNLHLRVEVKPTAQMASRRSTVPIPVRGAIEYVTFLGY